MTKFHEDESPIYEELEPLIKTLESDPDWNKRFGAASKLFRLGKEKAVNPLIKALQNDNNKEIKRFSADLLGLLGDSRATWALIAVLRQAIVEKDLTMVNHSSDALIKIKGKDFLSILISTINDKQEISDMKIKALELLGRLGDSQSVESLTAIINNPNTDGDIRAKAIEELVYTGNLSGLQLILEYLSLSSNRAFQKIVIHALGKTPFKNKAIAFRIGESVLKIMENEESKKEKKDKEVIDLSAAALTQLANNINYDFRKFVDEIISIRKKQKIK